MGACTSGLSAEDREAIDRSRKIDRVMVTDSYADLTSIKLLLLGAGESGKSTILKQIKILYGNGFRDEERASFRNLVWINLMESFKTLCERVQNLQMEEQLSAKAEFHVFLNASVKAEVTPAMGVAMEALWLDPICQLAWNQRSTFQVIDTLPTYLQQIHEIASPTYIPTDDDMLLARVRSTGICEETFTIDNATLTIFDVGGQRNERKKWIHCFDGITAVMFVAALNEFDQTLFEDDSMNRMIEAIALFDEICNSRWFVATDMILFLNKDDLFQEKIRTVNISSIPEFADFTGTPYSYEEGVQYFLGKFTALNRNPNKEIYHHVTCGINTENFSRVFSACKDIIFKRELEALRFSN